MRDFHRDRVARAREHGESMFVLWVSTAADMVWSAMVERIRPIAQAVPALETIAGDAAYAARGLRRRPGFTAIVVGAIALGVGANAAIFSVVNGILIRPLPYPNADQVFSFGHEPPQWLTSAPNFLDYRRDMKSVSGLAAYGRGNATLVGNDAPERVHVVRASEDFFPVLGVHPYIGRSFANDEYAPRISSVIVLSYALWQRDFGGDRGVLGHTVSLEGIPRTVVGVMPAGFSYPDTRIDAWMPLQRFNPDSAGDRSNNFLFMVGRLAPGATLEKARVEARTIAKRIMATYPQNFDPAKPLVPHLSSVTDDLVGNTRPYLLALLGAVAFVLIIACANVANLLLVRGEGRQKEMSVRSALGASPGRLLTQLLTESVLLALAGASLGLLLAWAGDRGLVALAPASIPRRDAIAIDWHVVAFTACTATLTSLFIGAIPAWRASRADAADALKEGARGSTLHSGARAIRRALVVAEMALAVMALTGAGMLLRSLWNLEQPTLGFDPQHVLTARVSLLRSAYKDDRAALFFDQLLAKIRTTPGVHEAGASGWLPVVDAGGLWGYQPEGGTYPDGRWPSAVPQQATAGYFAAAGIKVLEGRGFDETDRAGSLPVAVVSKRFADLTWPHQDAIGKQFKLGGPASPLMTIVGVVDDIRARGFGDTPEPTMYFAFPQSGQTAYNEPREMSLLIRVNGNPMHFVRALTDAVHALDATVPASDIQTLGTVVQASVSSRRFNTALLAAFAGLALLLAAIGTYGVISYTVTQRRFEIGVRMALGAEDRSVVALVMSEGMRLALLGLVLGVLASLAVGRAIGSMLVDVRVVDLPSIAVTALLLAVVAIIASLVPARRALRVNPIDALRSE
jgi:predicted permease